jgi:integrase
VSSDEWHHHRRSNTVSHCKEDALDEREFELLVEGTRQLRGYRRTEAEFLVFVAGRLGLRRGELTHLRSDWVNQREKIIEIPAHQSCDKGRDGGICGHCRQLVEQCAEINGLQSSELKANWWRPKTEAAVRGVPYDWSPRAEIAIERFCDEFDRFERSSTGVSRRITAAAEHAPQLDPDDLYPHALRATAATYQVSRGLGTHALTSMMGWGSLQTAEVYISNSDQNTRRAVRAAHNQ